MPICGGDEPGGRQLHARWQAPLPGLASGGGPGSPILAEVLVLLLRRFMWGLSIALSLPWAQFTLGDNTVSRVTGSHKPLHTDVVVFPGVDYAVVPTIKFDLNRI